MSQQSIASNTDYSLMSSAHVNRKSSSHQPKTAEDQPLPRLTNDSFETKHEAKKTKTVSPKPPAKEQGVSLVGTALIALASLGVGGGVMFLGAKHFNWFGLGEKAQATVTEIIPKTVRNALALGENGSETDVLNAIKKLKANNGIETISQELKKALDLTETATKEEVINAISSLKNPRRIPDRLSDISDGPNIHSLSLQELEALVQKEGNPEHQYRLAKRYANNSLSIEDDKKAFEMLKQAADQNHEEAQCSLGDCYRYGKGTDANMEKAIECFTEAAKAGNMDAQFSLGLCHRHEDDETAKHWFKQAAKQGCITSRRILLENYGINDLN